MAYNKNKDLLHSTSLSINPSTRFTRSGLIYLVRRALKEDIGRADITTETTVPRGKLVRAVLLAKQDCVVCGLDIACLVFKTKDNKIRFKPVVKDGAAVRKGKILAYIKGRAQSILTAERVALNYLCLLSGVATQTRSFVNAVRPYKAKIMDTRKTIPGLRLLQKYAVRTGGGYNHRMRLDEMVLVKDNHLKVAGLKRIKDKIASRVKIEFEVKTLREFKEALKLKPDIIMLDNMGIREMKEAVRIRNGAASSPKPKLEASGGITLANVKKIAATGVEMISIGALTHSVNSVDISLEVF